MQSISIRGVDEQLAGRLKKEAAKQGKSVNQLVLETLRQHVGLDKELRFTREYDDLDHLFGRWSKQEYEEIQGKIDAERQIDDEIWK